MHDAHDDPEYLVEELLVAAAGIMEEASAAIVALDDQCLVDRVALVREAGQRIAALGEAADALLANSP